MAKQTLNPYLNFRDTARPADDLLGLGKWAVDHRHGARVPLETPPLFGRLEAARRD